MENMTAWATPEYKAPSGVSKLFRWFVRHKLAAISVVIILTLYVLGIFSEWIAPYDPNFQDFTGSYKTSSWDHWFGTDALGRDYFSRIIFALRTTVGLTAATLFTGAGFAAVFLALLSGYKRGWVDAAVMRAGEFSALFPELLFMILIAATIGPRYHALMKDVTAWDGTVVLGSLAPVLFAAVIICIGCAIVAARRDKGALTIFFFLAALTLFGLVAFSWLVQTPGFADFFLIYLVLLPFSWYGAARLVRSQVLSLREQEFVLAARAIGASDTRIVLQHLLPNVLGLVVYLFSIGFAGIAVAELSLTYLGLGVQPPHASFGTLIFEAGFIRTLEAHPHLMLIPAAAVGLFLYAFNLLGEALGESVTLLNRR